MKKWLLGSFALFQLLSAEAKDAPKVNPSWKGIETKDEAWSLSSQELGVNSLETSDDWGITDHDEAISFDDELGDDDE